MSEDNALILLCKLQITLSASLFLNIIRIAWVLVGWFGNFWVFGAFGIFCLFDFAHGLFGCEVLFVCFFFPLVFVCFVKQDPVEQTD